jgi:hypothetical protein
MSTDKDWLLGFLAESGVEVVYASDDGVVTIDKLDQPKCRPGERWGFIWEDGQRYTGLVHDNLKTKAWYGFYHIIDTTGAEHGIWTISERNIISLMPEPVLDESVAQRFIDYPTVRMVHDRDGVRFVLVRRDANDVAHVDLQCEPWPRDDQPLERPYTRPPVFVTGTITGMRSAPDLLLALQVAESSLLENLKALLKEASDGK